MRIIFKKSYEADIRLFKDGVQATWYLILLAIAVLLPFFINEYRVDRRLRCRGRCWLSGLDGKGQNLSKGQN